MARRAPRAPRIVLLLALFAPQVAFAGSAVVTPLIAKGVEPKVSAAVTGLVSSELDFSGAYETVTELPQLPATLNAACLTQVTCLAGIAKAGGADAVLTGSVGPGSQGLQIQLVLYDGGKIKGKQTFETAGDPATLADSAGKWVKSLLSGTPAAVTAAAEAPPSFDSEEEEDEFAFETKAPAAAAKPSKTRTENKANPRELEDEDSEEEVVASSSSSKSAAAERAREEAEAKAEAEARAKAKAEAEARAKADAESKAKAKAEAERKAREEAERIAREEEEEDRRRDEARKTAEAARRAREEEEEASYAKASASKSSSSTSSKSTAKPKVEEEDEEDFEFGSAAAAIEIETEDEPEEEEPPPARTSSSSSRSSSSSSKQPTSSSGRSTSKVVVEEDEPEDEPVEDDEELMNLDDEEEAPRSKARSDDDDEERPSSRSSSSRSRSDEDEDPPSSRSSASRSRDDDDDRSSSRSGSRSSSSSRSSSRYDDLDGPTRKNTSDKKPGVALIGRVGYSRYFDFNFLTYGGELSIPVAPVVHILAGMEGFSTQRQYGDAACEKLANDADVDVEDYDCSPWQTILPVNVGVIYKANKSAVRPYGGIDFTFTPYTTVPDIALGARARGGADFMVAPSFGFNVNLSVGVMWGEKLEQTQDGIQNLGLIPQVSAGTIIQF